MPVYKIKFKCKREIAAGTMAFYFEKPAGFAYTAGQFAILTLLDPSVTDDEGNSRVFSFASAPYEDDLMFAARMRDTAFKQALRTMAPGTELSLEGPYGSFTLHDNVEIPAVFLTGGIGVTPVRSIVLQAIHDEAARRIFVYYSNRSPEDAAFMDELAVSRQENPYYTCVGTMTQMTNSNQEWHGERGYISQDMLLKSIDDLTLPIYYVDGPPVMVSAIRKTLSEAGVSDGNIRTEKFSGY